MSRIDNSSSVLLLFELHVPKELHFPVTQLRTEFTRPIAISTGPQLSDTTFFASWSGRTFFVPFSVRNMITPVCNKWACGLSNTIELGLSRGALDLRIIGIWIGSGKTFTGELLVSCGSGSSAAFDDNTAVCLSTGDLEFDVVDVSNGSWTGLGAIVDSSCVLARSVDDSCTKKQQQQQYTKLRNTKNGQKGSKFFILSLAWKVFNIIRRQNNNKIEWYVWREELRTKIRRRKSNPQPEVQTIVGHSNHWATENSSDEQVIYGLT